ncbi:MAG: prepilin peptidase [Lachnospiraceae bacterium]|nr:prepilin peptidase [Lachnospiraceae bacterium]
MNIIFIIFLCTCTVFDIRKKEIPIHLILIGLISSFGVIMWQIFEGTVSVTGVGVSFLPGLFFLLISFFTKEKIGYGDGLILIISGLILGFYQCFLGLCISLICSSVFALLLLVLHKVKRDSKLAFVPFLTIGIGVSFFVY